MEFKEFINPEEEDYDINSSLNNDVSSNDNIQSVNPYAEQLIDLIGILEDITEDELQEQYGISIQEYYRPTQETINKVSKKINGRHK